MNFMTKEDFLKDVGSWSNHRHLLWDALEATSRSMFPVAEFGAGEGSTPYLRQYCQEKGREFFSYESNEEWAEKCGSAFIEDWNKADIWRYYSVVLIDHAPGEHRHEAIAILKDMAGIIVIHDTEPAATGYMLDKIWGLFKYRVDFQSDGAWASAVSNSIDLTNLVS